MVLGSVVVGSKEFDELLNIFSVKASAEKTYSSWQEGYKDILVQTKKEYSTEEMCFSLVYIDNDDIPELVVYVKDSCHAYGAKLYSYANGKVNDLDYYGGYGVFSYIEKEGYIESWYSSLGVTINTIYKLNNGDVSTIISFFDNTAMGDDVNQEYKINDIDVSKEEYDKNVKEWETKNGKKQIMVMI